MPCRKLLRPSKRNFVSQCGRNPYNEKKRKKRRQRKEEKEKQKKIATQERDIGKKPNKNMLKKMFLLFFFTEILDNTANLEGRYAGRGTQGKKNKSRGVALDQ